MTAERAAATRVFAPPIVGVTYREQLQGCKASCAIKQACTPFLPEALLAGTQNRSPCTGSFKSRCLATGNNEAAHGGAAKQQCSVNV